MKYKLRTFAYYYCNNMSLVLKEFLRDQEEHSATYIIIIEEFPKKKNQYISGAVAKSKPFTIRNSLKTLNNL